MDISPYVLTILVSWVAAQGAKYIILASKQRTLRGFRQLYLSGNLPSAHTAAVVSMTTLIGLKDGLDGPIFGLAVMVAAVVMYDAVMARRSVGEQGEALQQVIRATKSKVPLPRAAKGHKPVEVAVGAVVGVLVGLVVFIATK